MTRRDTVVIGASAGGVDAIPRILGQLPDDFPAAIIIVQHLSPDTGTSLAAIFQRQSRLPVHWIEQGARIEDGQVYLAPPNLHALVIDGHLQLVGGAKENLVRPSIDRMFRSAAVIRGSRVIAVLLTGMLDDGVAGMRAVQQAGGVTIIQDPGNADYPELPSRALVWMVPDRVLSIDSVGAALVQLTREGPAETEPPRRLETSTEEIETALWSAIRALHDRAMTFDELAGDALRAGNLQTHQIYLTRANVARTQAETARAFVLDLATSTTRDPAIIP